MLDLTSTKNLLKYLSPEEMAELEAMAKAAIWLPLPGPQMEAYYCEADELFYGGAAGGGKSDLLLGLALTAHRRSIIFRREAPQLQGILDRLHQEILKSKAGYNGQDKIQRLSKGRQIEFGSCPHLGDESRFQGRPHDLICLEKGTPVLMGDGSYTPIEYIKTGDSVMTLEGPKTVLMTFDKGFGKAVSATAYLGTRGVFHQVQGANHSLLTNAGWVSHDMLSEEYPSLNVSHQPIQHHVFCNNDLSKYNQLLIVWKSLLKKCSDQLRIQGFFQQDHHRSLLDFFFSLSPKYLEIYFLSFVRLLLGYGQHLSKTFLQELSELIHGLFSPLIARPSLVHATCDALSWLKQEDSLDDCLSGSHPYGGHVHQDVIDGLFYLQQQGGVGRHIPKCFEDSDLDKVRRHILHKQSYVHPYTLETRQAYNSFVSLPLKFSPVGYRHLYDLMVEGSNHYISYNGFVNKNCFDEITHFLPQQYTFLTGWLRTTYPGQRCRIVAAGNPPTNSDGEWVTRHWGPWLNQDHPRPAKPGQLLWFAMIDGKETMVDDSSPIEHNGEIIIPRSRTFIASSVEDNPFLMATGYRSMLQSLPEPLRSQMLHGDFTAGMDDDVWQVIPTEWIRQAQARWEQGRESDRMDSLGVDVARGGSDETVISRRHGNWFDNLLIYPGAATPNGAAVAALIFTSMRDGAPVHVDVIGVGSSVYDHCHSNGITVKAINGAEKPISEFDSTGTLRFVNRRAELYWKLREALDPQNKQWICLPKDPQLKADLCAPRWKLTPRGIQVESKEDIIKRIGRSPDRGDAVVYGLEQTIPAHIYQSHSEPDFIEVF